MTCNHVLGLIDAGPFADYPRAHLDAAWRHARECATCGPALHADAALTKRLAQLPQPSPAPDLAAAVFARVTRIERMEWGHAARTAAAATGTRATAHDWPAWATVVGGITAGLAIIATMPPGDSVSLASLEIGSMTPRALELPATLPGGLVLAAGLLLYMAGLFARRGGVTTHRDTRAHGTR